jgi:DNA-binding transcriptional ArsR family regulator
MADLLPSTSDTSAAEEADPRVIGLGDDDADELIAALSAGTAREVLAALHEEPDTPSAVADRVDTSLQNAQYHLGNLEDAGLIDVVDTIYSEKGREMSVYAPVDRPLVVFAGAGESGNEMRSAIESLLGAVGVLAAVSLAVQWALADLPLLGGVAESADAGGGDGGGGGMSTMSTEAAPTAADAGAALPPGLLVFVGGLAALTVVAGVWYLRRRRA